MEIGAQKKTEREKEADIGVEIGAHTKPKKVC